MYTSHKQLKEAILYELESIWCKKYEYDRLESVSVSKNKKVNIFFVANNKLEKIVINDNLYNITDKIIRKISTQIFLKVFK